MRQVGPVVEPLELVEQCRQRCQLRDRRGRVHPFEQLNGGGDLVPRRPDREVVPGSSRGRPLRRLRVQRPQQRPEDRPRPAAARPRAGDEAGDEHRASVARRYRVVDGKPLGGKAGVLQATEDRGVATDRVQRPRLAERPRDPVRAACEMHAVDAAVERGQALDGDPVSAL